jgi:hypothetical protein
MGSKPKAGPVYYAGRAGFEAIKLFMTGTISSCCNGCISRLAILITDHILYNDMGQMVVDTLTRMGIETRLFQKNTEGIERWPAVLIIGDTALINKYDVFFRRLGSNKPLVLFWYLEPLGPGNMSQTARKLGNHLADCYWPKILPADLGRFFRSHQPGQKPRKNYAINLIRTVVAWKLKKQIEQDCGYRCPNLDSRDLFFMMYRSRQFVEHFINPWIDGVFTSTPSRKEHIEQLGIPAEFVPVGWHPMWGHYQNLVRDTDVVFLGNIRKKNDHRARVIRTAQKQLALKGHSIKVIDGDCFGRTRTELLNRTKILLDVVRAPWEIPGMRLLIGMSCGAMVMSCGFRGNAGPYRPGIHFIEAGPETLVDTLVNYLKNENQRSIIAEAGRKLVMETLTMENCLNRILEQAAKSIHKHRGD